MKEGLRQGRVLSPILFVIVMNAILRRVEPTENVDTITLVYGDDVAVWGVSSAKVESKIDQWNEIRNEILKISVGKIESPIMGKKLDEKREKIRLTDILTKDAKVNREVEAMISKVKFYQSVGKLIRNKEFPICCKLTMY